MKSEGELLYQSEEQTGQKTFQFCDAMINKDLISCKNQAFVIEIYEKLSLIGKTKPLELLKLKANTKSFEVFDSNNREMSAKLEVVYSERKAKNFIDYLRNGLQIRSLIAIDFTSSNLVCNNKESLHYLDNFGYNIYEIIIMNCGKILENYDNKKLYSVYGFGAIPSEKDEVSHCFNVNSKNEPNIQGLSSVIEHYRKTIQKLRFLGPTYFRYFLKNMIDNVKKSVNNNENTYFISVILTDGLINDMEETIDLLVEASKLPISFIIIGVGNGDFGNMNILSNVLF